MHREKRFDQEFQGTHDIALRILNDAVIFWRMSKGLELMKGAHNPQDFTYHDEGDPWAFYNGCSIVETLMMKENEREVIGDEIHEIFDRHIEKDLIKDYRNREIAKEIAKSILFEYENLLFRVREHTRALCN